MNTKAVLASTAAAGLLGLGMLAGSLIGPGVAAAQVPKELAAGPIAQTAPATPGTTTPGSTAPGTTAPGSPAPSTSKAAITQQQAEAAALAASPGATVDHTRLGNENGTLIYDVDFTNGGGVVVNATTGAVIATEAAGADKGGRGEVRAPIRRPSPPRQPLPSSRPKRLR